MKKYSIILADPPWSFKAWSNKGKGRSPENHYDCLNLDQICRLQVSSIADDNCALFLWVTSPNLMWAERVIKAWGFDYRTIVFYWDKETKRGKDYFGQGYYSRASLEICLLAMKGRLEVKSHSVRQKIRAKVREHSRKPDETHDLIVQLFGDLPRIELFARQKVDGWDSWGNEVKCDIDLGFDQQNQLNL